MLTEQTCPGTLSLSSQNAHYCMFVLRMKKKATFDLSNIMTKGIFFPVIKEEEMFNKVGVVDGAVAWAWGLDLAPDNLYKLALETPDTTIVL